MTIGQTLPLWEGEDRYPGTDQTTYKLLYSLCFVRNVSIHINLLTHFLPQNAYSSLILESRPLSPSRQCRPIKRRWMGRDQYQDFLQYADGCRRLCCYFSACRFVVGSFFLVPYTRLMMLHRK